MECLWFVVEGCWQTPHLDIIEKIVQRLDLLDRVRSLSIPCKYWSSIALRRDICTANQFPWLLRTKQASTCRFNGGSKLSSKYLELELEFSILPEGNVLKPGLSKQNQGWFHSSCKGRLIMVNEENTEVFLLNPISGAKHELPSLTQIPSLETFGAETADLLLHKIALFKYLRMYCGNNFFF